MATGWCFILRWIHCDSHCFSCGQTRPQTAGRDEDSLMIAAAPRMSPVSRVLINPGMLIFTGHPCTQVGFLQLRQRWDSVIACSKVRPWLTSSCRDLTRTSGRSSGICTRGIATRSLGVPVYCSTSIEPTCTSLLLPIRFSLVSVSLV